MAVPVCNYWNPLFPSSIILPCSLLFFFTLYYFPLHATTLSFNFSKIDQTLQNIKVITNPPAYINDKGILVTPNDIGTNRSQRASRTTYKDPLHPWDKASGNLTDFNTYFSFVIDSQRRDNYGDGLAFFLVPNGSTPNITSGGAMGLPINPQTIKWTTPFVAVEFKTCPNNVWDPKETHVGIDINSLTSNATQLQQDIILRNIQLNHGNSTLQIDVPTEPDPSPALGPNTVIPSLGKKMGAKTKKALVVGLIVGSLVLVGGLALVGFVMWKKSRAKEEDEFAIEISVNNKFEAVSDETTSDDDDNRGKETSGLTTLCEGGAADQASVSDGS
ncbi:hypothetical protein LOK49_LG12G00383 [Camellia lanceoleosa]|uniref:Uncharacterized protein n=1 Tax=Camellia lanceoleosa TaxID=1840588 RepID=A0ACC0FRU5_9ERIC|nr:hypothetical protein LOK49_LG12G00383 [Camellia lanceoleosa]